MLNELVRRFSAGKSERRGAERVRKRFPVAWLRDGALVPGQGLEISEKGVLFATKDAPSGSSVDVAMDLGTHRVRARLTITRQGSMARESVEWAVIAGVFQGIAADDWDAIVRFCKQLAEPSNKSAEELATLHAQDDDAYRLLPLKVQERVVKALIDAGRLAPDSDAKNPLLRMTYTGQMRSGNHRLAVRSRRNLDGEVLNFDSSLTIDDAGNVTLDR